MTITIQKHSLRLDTKNYTLADIMDEVTECTNLLSSLGYDMSRNTYKISWNTRAYRRLGQCSYKGVGYDGKKTYHLNFNKHYFETAEPRSVHNTIMHEVCHSVTGCMNHQAGGWKDVVARVNEKFGYNISRTTNDPNYKALVLDKREKAKNQYNIYCSCCGKVVCTYQRKTKAVVGVATDPSRWRCGGCNQWGTLSIR